MEENLPDRKKLTMGRRKIDIKKIQKKTSLQVTFTKRRTGLFKKASELSILTASDIAILIESPAKKVYSFGTPSVESVLRRFDTGAGFTPNDYHSSAVVDQAIRECEEAAGRLEKMKMEEIRSMNDGRFWWEQQVDGMELQELEEYLESLEGLRKNVLCRVEEIEILRNYSSSSGVLDMFSSDQGSMEGTSGGFPVDQCNCNNQELQKLFEIDIHDEVADDDVHTGKDEGASLVTNSFDLEDSLFTSTSEDSNITFDDLDLEAYLAGCV